MLADIYNWFAAGFDSADLKEAKTLLEELSNLSAERSRITSCVVACRLTPLYLSRLSAFRKLSDNSLLRSDNSPSHFPSPWSPLRRDIWPK
jgi:hypothetical protein